jgi:uncharacterized membrane protein YccC
MLGGSPETLLVLRLEETVIGAAAAMFVAFFVLPTRTRDEVRRAGRAVLVELRRVVEASRHAISGNPEAAPMVAMRRVDRQVAALRLALAPLTAGRALLRRNALERPVPALLECVHWARVLATASHAGAGARPAAAAAFDARARRIEARLARLAGVAEPVGEPASATAAHTTDRDDPDAAGGELDTALDKLDQAVTILAERMKIGALQGFALES